MISNIDSNFKVETTIEREQLMFYDAETSPFQIYGLMREEERFCRMPKSVAQTVNEGVLRLYANTAGGRMRFVTDSPYVAISAELEQVGKMPHMPLTGSAGFDLYVNEGKGQQYYGTFVPPYQIESKYESVHDFPSCAKREITIYFPPYSNVKKIYIGLKGDSVLESAPNYHLKTPIVYYGSSITQGACASRPGNSYQNIISRWLDVDYINLGFAGSGRAEDTMVDYLADMEMSLLVCDYDYNAPNAAYLRKTHLPFYRTIRKKQPDLPILFISAPTVLLRPDKFLERRDIVRDTYQVAISEGDKNVYYIDGLELFAGDDWDFCTVDGVHPNDLGFYRMAKRIEQEIRRILI